MKLTALFGKKSVFADDGIMCVYPHSTSRRTAGEWGAEPEMRFKDRKVPLTWTQVRQYGAEDRMDTQLPEHSIGSADEAQKIANKVTDKAGVRRVAISHTPERDYSFAQTHPEGRAPRIVLGDGGLNHGTLLHELAHHIDREKGTQDEQEPHGDSFRDHFEHTLVRHHPNSYVARDAFRDKFQQTDQLMRMGMPGRNSSTSNPEMNEHEKAQPPVPEHKPMWEHDPETLHKALNAVQQRSEPYTYRKYMKNYPELDYEHDDDHERGDAHMADEDLEKGMHPRLVPPHMLDAWVKHHPNPKALEDPEFDENDEEVPVRKHAAEKTEPYSRYDFLRPMRKRATVTFGPGGDQQIGEKHYEDDEEGYYKGLWNRWHPLLQPTIHRHLALDLPKDHPAHDTSLSTEQRAHSILDHVSKGEAHTPGRLGYHWTDDPEYDHLSTGQRIHSGQTSATIHAQTPPRHHIEDNEYELKERRAVHDWDTDEREVPLKRNAPVNVTGVSWHSVDGPQHHSFEQPITKRAAAPPSDYARRDGEDHYDHEGRVRHGLSMGHLTYAQAYEHGYHGSGREDTRDSWTGQHTEGKGWQPLPQELYHTTTNAAGVMQHGLKSAQELGHKNGHGLGGTPQWLSMTYSADHAHNMLDALHEYHAHLNGKTSFEDLHKAAQNGEGAQQPFHEAMMSTFGREPDAVREARMQGKRIEPGFAAHEEAAAKGWEPHSELHQNFGQGKDGRTYGSGWTRPASIEEKHDEYGAFSRARQFEGNGKPSMLFLSNDRKAFAAKDPKNFAVLKLRPKLGAQGFPMEGEHEWRTGTGHAVDVEGEPIRRKAVRTAAASGPHEVDLDAMDSASSPDTRRPSVADDPGRWEHRQRQWDTQRPEIEHTHDHGWFSVHAEPADEEGDRQLHAVTHDGQYIGETFFGDHPTRPDHLEGAPEVHPGYRRKGVGSAMYDYASELHGKPLAPAESHTDDAAGLWQSRTSSVADGGPVPEGTRGEDSQGHRVEMTPQDGWAHPDGSHGHQDGPDVGERPVYTKDHTWLPEGRYWGPNSAQNDQRLFQGDHLRPEVRQDILDRVGGVLGRHDGWEKWTRVYFAGSQAAQWLDQNGQGNGDFDILIGIDFDEMRDLNPQFEEMEDAEIASTLTDELWTSANVKDYFFTLADGRSVGPFERTFFVNARAWDIKNLHPYAAYNVTSDDWAVHPLQVPQDWSATHLPESYWGYAESLLHEIQAIGQLPAEERHRMAANLWEELHTHRSDAFADGGHGLFDLSNIIEKYLDQHPDKPWAKLVQWKNESPSDARPWVPTTARRITLSTLFDSKLSGLDFKQGAEGADTGGIMIAIVPPKRIRQDLAVEDGEPVEAMHVTLAYMGGAKEYTAKQRRDLHGLVEGWARTQKPLTANVGGAGTFTNPGQHVLWAAVDIPGGGPFRESLVEILELHGYNVRNDHGWTPHLTLSYGKSHFRFLPKVEPAAWDVTEIHVCVGGHWEAVPLGS